MILFRTIFGGSIKQTGMFLRLSIAMVTVFSISAASVTADDESADLTSQRQIDDIDRVDTLLEAEGKVMFGNGPEDHADLHLSCRYQYDERLLRSDPITIEATESEGGESKTTEDPAGARLAVRQYKHLEGKLGEGERQAEIGVRPERMMLGVMTDSEGVTVYSPEGPLTADELDTFDTPANSVLLDRLLPGRTVKVGETWTHDDRLVAAMLRLEAIASNKLTSKLATVDERFAQIELTGQVEGADDGIANTVDVKAKYRFNLQTGRIDWLAMLIHQRRGISRVGDGLDVKLRLQTQVISVGENEALTDESLAGMAIEPGERHALLSHESSDKAWTIEHDRNWTAIMGTAGRTVLRFIDRGSFAVQCVAASMPTTKPEEAMNLAQFQHEIESKLGDYFGSFVSAAQSVTPTGLTIYEVAALGQIEQLEVHWVYYLVVDPYGRQMVLALTMQSDLYDKYKDLGDNLAESVRFPAKIRTSLRPSR